MTTNATPSTYGRRPTLVHVFPTFAVGGAQTRFCDIANDLGDRYRHLVISLDGNDDAGGRVSQGVPLEVINYRRCGSRGFGGIRETLQRLRPDLLLTYNWGAMEWVMANSVCRLAPHIHTEDGFNEDEAHRQKTRRVLARKVFLRTAHSVVVPSLCLRSIAERKWSVPPRRLRYIPNGVDLAAAARCGGEPAHPQDTVVIGTVASVRKVKNLPRLVRLFKRLPDRCRVSLSIVGDGPDLEAVRREAGDDGRIVFHGYQSNTFRYISAFDIFASTSDSEQMPIAVAEAMAMGKAVASTDVGDIRNMVSELNRPFVVPVDQEERLLHSMLRLIDDLPLRSTIGEANRKRCTESFDKRAMLAAYASLYRDSVRRSPSTGGGGWK